MKLIIKERVYELINYKHIYNIKGDVSKHLTLFTFTNDIDILFLKELNINSKVNIGGHYYDLKSKDLELDSLNNELVMTYIVEKGNKSQHIRHGV